MIAVSPDESDVVAAAQAFLIAVLPAGTPVVLGQVNLVPEPAATLFAILWPVSRPRLATNISAAEDVRFTASIATGAPNGTMTVSAVQIGAIAAGTTVFGSGVAAGTVVVQQLTGSPGGPGTYSVSPSQAVASGTMAAGDAAKTQKTEVIIQVDVHAPDLLAAGNVAATIATLWRDPYASEFFADPANAIPAGITPLFCDDPRQLAFWNSEQMFESRYTIDLHLQADQTVRIPQQYADAVSVTTVSVDAAYPPQ